MAEQTEGFLSPDASEPLQPAAVAEELAATDANAADLPAALREDQIQNAVSFLSHPKVKHSLIEQASLRSSSCLLLSCSIFLLFPAIRCSLSSNTL